MSAHSFVFLVWHVTQQFLENWWAKDKFLITQDSHGGSHLAKGTLHTWPKLWVFYFWNVPCLLRFRTESLRAGTVACSCLTFLSQVETPHVGQRSHEVSTLNANTHFPVTGISPSEAPESSTKNCTWGNADASVHLRTLVTQGAMRSLRQCLCVLPLLK